MTNPRATILLCQPCDFQRWVWQRVLRSQNLAVILTADATHLLKMLEETRSSGNRKPAIILIDRQTPDLQLEEFCLLCQENYAEIPVILLESTDSEVSHYQRQAAIAYGAIDILPPFEADTLALKVIAGIKKVLSALGGLIIHNDPLVSCLLALKQDMENAQSLSTPSVAGSLNNHDVFEYPADSFSVSEVNREAPVPLQPVPSVGPPGENSSKKARHKRVYRGRVY
ncbi:response regulator [Roseofilum reptotaenium CS-1145]|uniref:response regulator n=1 Tax=Roseofilum TaxID=1233426 RepID=UPI000AFD487D|nr:MULTISPECIES: response regulator [Roseofilum]MBP0030631.1 response regulator [Roseofilum sp. Guam]MDB9515395.1 response regulator [Roseofilum reptotaenium CS-1145]